MNGPHRIVSGLLDGVARQAKSVGVKIQDVLDKPPEMVGIRPGPNRIPDSLLDGLIDGIMAAGRGISDALDQPFEVVVNIKRRF